MRVPPCFFVVVVCVWIMTVLSFGVGGSGGMRGGGGGGGSVGEDGRGQRGEEKT